MSEADSRSAGARAAEPGTVEAALVGGPADIPESTRRCRADAGARTIKLAHRGGYEHFELVDAADAAADGPAVFRWTTRTKIAE
ncbi:MULTISPECIES: DUF5988 family protein [Actinomadura]|uniref:Uncharacterized protein n=2 Tax=Actinomadura TaxID=1988 RepID=A0A5D0UGH7_9ACTN|nr:MULTISPECIES: DUF5988 family protein [Actinomadura]TYC17498.1 hypothetical protein FXF65_05690 [Actinomadura syzygii]TYK52754.1 hypothetical protein FXF68_03095 [Actinomadura decatromicini]